jgi:hypothetical protein
MKKAFSILMILLVLLFSLHVTVATHFCGAKVASVKVGLEGTTTSCGMVQAGQSTPETPGISAEGCCKNASNILIVDNYTTSSSLEIQKANYTLLQVFLIPVFHLSQVLSFNNSSSASDGFLHVLKSLPERLAFICVFRK